MPVDGYEARRLKVLMTADAVGGVWQYAIDLIAALEQTNTQVLLAVLGPPPSAEQRHQISALRNASLAVGEFALEWMDNSWAEVDRAGDWLLRLASDFGPDVIHLNGYAHAACPWSVPRIVVAHSCVSSWWRAVYNEYPGPAWDEYRRRVKAGLAAADCVVAPSKFMAEAVAALYHFPADRIRVVPNFSRAAFPDVIPKERFILASGRAWDPAKNLGVLIEAARDVPWEVRIAGDVRFEQHVIAPQTHVSWLGKISHPALMQEMSRAAIFAHPALYEPFGLSVLEAANAGCALVLSDIAPMRELWDSAALFVHARESAAWGAAMSSLIAEPARIEQLGTFARRKAAEYSTARAADSYMQLYRDLVHRNSDKGSAAA
jgi:glycosyltransferase involved in cell wall biosynthesis